MNIQKRLISTNFTKGGNKKLGIAIHTMVGTLDGTDSFFRQTTTQASSHYGVSLDGTRVYQWVEEGDQAYAQGIVSKPTFKMVTDRPGVNPNTYLISIECDDNRDPAVADRSKQLPVIVELVRDIAKRNNIPIDRDHICGHKEIRSTKTCPGNLNVDEIVKLAANDTIDDDMPTWLSGLLQENNITESQAEGRIREIFDQAKRYEQAQKERDKALRDLAEARGDSTKFEELLLNSTKENRRLLEELETIRKQIVDRDTQINSLTDRVKVLESKLPKEGTITIPKTEYVNLKARTVDALKTLDLLTALIKRTFKR